MAGTAVARKKSGTTSNLRKMVTKDIASLKANHKDQIAAMKKRLESARKSVLANADRLKKQAAAQQKKVAAELAKMKKQAEVQRKKASDEISRELEKLRKQAAGWIGNSV